MSLSDAANWASVVTVPLTLLAWFFTRERFAVFWKRQWKLVTMALFAVSAIAAARMGWFSLLNFQITWPLWKLIVVGGIGLVIPLLVLAAAKCFNLLPNPAKYTHDEFFGVCWHWSFCGYELFKDDIFALCPNCSYQLDPARASLYDAVPAIELVCDHCGFRKRYDCNWDELRRKVLKEVQRLVRTEEWLQRYEKNLTKQK
jgi:Zn ribbon nucleic-acid-binding protein